MGIETNLSQSPYFDDFDENKNFHRILFRPGYSVQARELTQLQTILQNQIERFANEIVYDGTVITGCGVTTDAELNYVKIRDKDANNRVVLVSDFFSSGAVANLVIYGANTGLQAQLLDVAEGSEAAAPNNLTLFVKYINSGTSGVTKAFNDNEVLIARTRSANAFVVYANTIAANATGYGFRASVSDGIIYHKGHFVKVSPQSAVVDKYSTTPTRKLGFETRETIIDSNQDSSLLDNASGATNFSAPGANRLKLTPVLTSRSATAANTTTFFTIAQIEGGIVTQRFTDTQYSDIDQYMSSRAYETSGDFVVEPFNIRIREHLKSTGNLGRYNASGGGDVNKLVAEVEKGAGYIQGIKRSVTGSIFRDIDKATDVEVKNSRTIGQAFGNYVICREVVGTWDFQGIREVDLYSTQQKGISSGTLSLTGPTPNTDFKIGTARVRGLQWHEGRLGTSSGKLRIYIFDVKMNPAKAFKDVKALRIENSAGTHSMADIVLESNGTARIQESSLNTMVFPFTQSGTKTLKDVSDQVDTQWVVRKEKTVQVENGIALVTSNTAHAGGTEVNKDTGSPLTNTDERNILLVSKQPTQTAPHTGNVVSWAVGNTINLSGATALSSYRVGDLIKIVDGANTIVREITEITDDNTLRVSANIAYSRESLNLDHRTVFPSGFIFDLSTNGSITSTEEQHQIVLNRGVLESNFSASVYYDVLRTDANPAAKTAIKNKWVHINTQSHPNLENGPWCLGVSDVYKIRKVLVGTTTGVNSTSTDATTEFTLDSGQRDAYYGNAFLVKKPTSSQDTSDVGILVNFDYFDRDRSTGIGFLSVDSYPIDDANTANTNAITTQEIPVFISPTSGKRYDLRDSIDFRPIKLNAITPSSNAVALQTPSITNPVPANNYNINANSGAYFPTPDQEFQADVQFYLPRIDKIIINKEGAVEVVKGVPNAKPKAPEDKINALTLATINIPVYPSLSPYVSKQFSRPDYQVRLNIQNNRRYTMRDIRVLEDRIKNLEYYSSLNALESSSKNRQIFGDSGLDRFKNGFLVDNFDGHNIADTTKTAYRASIDRNNSLLRPSFIQTNIPLAKDLVLSSSNVTKKGNLVTLNYSHNVHLRQPYASKLRNPVQELTFNWVGDVILDPPMDNTPDVTTLPDIQIDFDGMYEAIQNIAQEAGITGTDWGNWNTVSSSAATTTAGNRITTTTQTEQIITGIQTSLSPSTETFSVGNFIENVAVREYMRTIPIRFTGVRMKPRTRVFPYFDDERVSEYCVPTNISFANTGSLGSNLVTDSTGTVRGIFFIPNDDNLKFRIGTRRFELKDVANTQTQSSLITTSAHGDFTSIKLDITQRGTSLSLTVPQLSRNTITDTRTLTSVTTTIVQNDNNRDPLSQTFSVSAGDSDGIFVSKLDLFFGKKSSTYPVTVQLREVENGFPTSTVLPYASKTLQASDVNANSVGSTNVTTFEFDSLVFLKNNKDYAMSVIPGGNSDEYALWVSRLGDRDANTNELIDKQPSSGILFTSANDKTWSPIQNEDLKFVLHRADFIQSSGTLYLENTTQDYFTLNNIVGEFKTGEKVTGGTSSATGFITFYDPIAGKMDVNLNSGNFTAETITGSVSSATASVVSVNNIDYNSIVPKIPQISPTRTNANWEVRTTSSTGVTGSFSSVDLGTDNSFTDSIKRVYSRTNQLSGTKTIAFKGTLSSTDSKVSPVVDVSRTNAIVIENIINNDTTGEEIYESGNALMRYISKPVELADGQDAEDLKVFVSAYRPSGTDVRVYARILNSADAEGLEFKNFTLLAQVAGSNSLSDSVDVTDYKEYEYSFSANTNGENFLGANSGFYSARLNTSDNDVVAYQSRDGSNHSRFKTFAIKIVATSTGSNVVPLIKDMRAIALQK